MALTTQQKKEVLTSLLAALDQDVYRQELELEAFQAELTAAGDNQGLKDLAQANITNVQNTISRLQARRDAWQTKLDAIK